MEHLLEKLTQYSESGIYPCHMPGHKRKAWGELPAQLYRLDITEIDGFDNLHQPEGILKELQEQAAACCGAEESYYLVNGSTGGILSAVSAALPASGHILMARNCHKSAYHAAYLRNLRTSYLYPKMLEDYDIFDMVSPEQIEEALDKEPDIQAVLLVSPTYEGRISNIRHISEIVHARGIPLIVDEAHGAHLGWSDAVHENSCRQGADLVIQSVHKTLPALTQTALLHVNGTIVDRERLRRFLHIYQSSSPSYLLMASIDNALQYMERDGKKALDIFCSRYAAMCEKLGACKALKFLSADRQRQDIGKLLISVKNTAITGRQLYDILLKRYRIQTEMAAETFVLAMFTVNDGQEGYDRMTAALLEIDRELIQMQQAEIVPVPTQDRIVPPVSEMTLTEAWDRPREEVRLEQSVGRVVGEFINLYPPGVPLLVPGERMSGELNRKIHTWIRKGMDVQGVRSCQDGYMIQVLTETEYK